MKRIGTLILFFSIAYVLLPANLQADNSDVNDDHKIVICHIPPGNPENARTIEIGLPALDAHLAHSDHVGECQNDDNNPPDNNSNTPPTWDGPSLATTTIGQIIQLTISATDIDSDPLVITYELPDGATYSATSSAFSWTPSIPGTTTAKFFAFDSKATSTHELVIEVASSTPNQNSPPDNPGNNPPTSGDGGNNTGGDNTGSGSNNSGNNGDSGNSSSSSGGGGGSSTDNSGSSNDNSANSGSGGSGGTGGVYPEVLTAPQYSYNNSGNGQVAGVSSRNLPLYFVNFNPGLAATSSWLYIYDVEARDPENDRLIYSLVANPDGMSIVSITGFIYWMPAENQVREEPYTVTIEVSDGINSVRETFQIKTNVNNPVTNSALLKQEKPIIDGTVIFTPPIVKGAVSNFGVSILDRNSDAKIPTPAGRWNFAALLFSGLFNTLKNLMNWILENYCWPLLILLIILLITFTWYVYRTRKHETRAKRINEELRKRLFESMERNRQPSIWPS